MQIRVQIGDRIGTTRFFRNRALLCTLSSVLARLDRPRLSVLFHAASVGAELYSFLIHEAVQGRAPDTVSCVATDLEPRFLEAARAAVYPAEILAPLEPTERGYFEPAGAGQVRVSSEIRNRVAFLPPASFVDLELDRRFDLVFLTNALIYVDGAAQSRALDHVARCNTGALVTTGFHMDRIKPDLERGGYRPVLENIEAIHGGWTDRLRLAKGFMIPGVTHYTPALEPFSPIPDYEYKYCAIFAKPELSARRLQLAR